MARQTRGSSPPETIDVMHTWGDSWNRGDLDAFSELFDVDAKVVTDPSWMEAGPFEGRAAIRKWFEGLRESWDERNLVSFKEIFQAGEKVVARFDWQVRGRTSGVEMDFDVTSITRFEGGRIVHQQYYFNHAEALQAVGLSE